MTDNTANIVTLDFETFWSKDHSLTKLTIPEYIYSPQFEAQSLAIRFGLSGKTYSVPHPDIPDFLRQVDFSKAILLGHNVRFDAYILHHVFKHTPALYIDTMAMARAVLGGLLKSFSLSSCLKHFGIAGKQHRGALLNTKGKRWVDMTLDERELLQKYNREDVDETLLLFAMLAKHFPKQEWSALSWTTKAFVESPLVLDATVLATELEAVRKHKAAMARKAGVTQAVLRSNPKFADLLRKHGVEPPVKISQTTGKETYAFARTDEKFDALVHHEDPKVRTLAEARLAVKSSIMETRCKKYLAIADLGVPWPVDLQFSGAHTTHRFSGASGGGGNPQNLSRGSALRKAICAPEGHKLVVSDLAGIEMRVFAWLAQVARLMQAVRDKTDYYCTFASDIYGVPVSLEGLDTASDGYIRNTLMRTVGKVAVLSLQYGAGGGTFRNMLRVMGGVRESLDFAKQVVNTYRSVHPEARVIWRQCDAMLRAMISNPPGTKIEAPAHWPVAEIGVDDYGGYIQLPRGLKIKYPNIKVNEQGDIVYYDAKRGSKDDPWIKTYGARVVENMCQALAREVIADKLDMVSAMYPTWMQVHDELVCCVPDDQVEPCRHDLQEAMTTPVTWWPDLPLGAETGVGPNYLEAK